MTNSKLILLLRTLSKKEFREFEKFVNSPYFNRLTSVKALFQVLKHHYPGFGSAELTEQNISKLVFGKEDFDYWKFKNLISDMLAAAEEFLAYKRFSGDEFNKKRYLLEELHAKNLDKAFEKNFKEARKLLDTDFVQSEDYYYKSYELELLMGTHQFERNDFSSENRLGVITDNFINYFLLRILKLYTYMVNEEIVFRSGNEKLVLINEIINHIKEYSYKDTPAVRIYFLILMLTMHGGEVEEYYFELKDIKLNNAKNLFPEELSDIEVCLVNYCTRMVLEGKDKFLREYFELLKTSIHENEAAGVPQPVSHFRFMNAAITGLKLGELKWVEDFISSHKDSLQPEYRSETVSLTTAMLLFSRKHFESALEELRKINFDDCHHKMHLRNLTLQIYYELEYFEPAISIIDSYKHFLSREKTVSELYRSYNANYVKYFAEALKIRMGVSELDAGELIHLINKEKEFANKKWILEKMNILASATKKGAN